MPNENQFSDIPSLSDTAGLETYLQNQQLAAQGVQPQAAEQAAAANQAAQPQPSADQSAGQSGAQQPAGRTYTEDELRQIVASLDRLQAGQRNAQLQQGQGQAQPRQPAYSQQEMAFIQKALGLGYGMDDINKTIMSRRAQAAPANINARISAIEQTLQSAAYKQAEAAFVDKMSAFGDRYGLSEDDLVQFANAAMDQGINIAMSNVNLDTVFRAVYPEQYAIRTQRMQATPSSQIYGGAAMPGNNAASAQRAASAYVENFLASRMPGQYQPPKK